MLTSITNAVAFFLAAIIPIPALRALCIMASFHFYYYQIRLHHCHSMVVLCGSMTAD